MMNRKAKGPTLTWLLIGVVVFVGIAMLIYYPDIGIYNGMMEANGKNIESEYSSAYGNLTSDKNALSTLSTDMLSTKNLYSIFTNAGIGLLNTLAIGLNVIGFLISIPTYIMHLNNVISEVIHIPTPIFWMLETILSIYIAIKLVQALRGTILEP